MRRFASVFANRRDKQPPPPLVTDHAHSSASSSSGSASLYLHTPEDDQHHLEVVDRNASKKSWKSWLKGSTKPRHQQQSTKQHWQNTNTLPDWTTPHELDDTHSEPSVEDEQHRPQDPRQKLATLVRNGLVPPLITPSPFAHRSDAPLIFPRRLLARLESDDPLTHAQRASIAHLASRRISPVTPLRPLPDPFNESVPLKTTVISSSSPGLSRWISRPCFEERHHVFLPQQDGSVSRHHVVGTALAVAALEYSEALEAMVDFDLQEIPPSSSSLVIEIPSSAPETASAPPSASGHTTRNSPYIAVPSPLRNEHNPPAPPAVAMSQSAPPAVPAIAATADPMMKRGVRFAEDDKDDVIPIGYVLRMKKRREEKAKFLQAEQQRRLLVEERMRMEEERRRQDEKRTMDEEKRNRRYTEEVIAARMRRESQRAGGVPALLGSENNGLLGNGGSAAGFFPASISSSTSERNKSTPAGRYSKGIHEDNGAPVHLPRREASEPNLPTITRTSPNAANVPMTHSHSYGSSNSHSPGSSRPPSVKGPPSVDSSPPLPGTRSPSVYSSQEISSSEDVKAAVAAAARRTKRNSLAPSLTHNNSSGSLSGDRASLYPVWTGSNLSLNNMVPPVPMIPMQMQMMPMPPFVMMDMPLLPPTPPFMMQQYPRQSGTPRASGSGSGSYKGRQSSSQNSSREKVNVVSGSGNMEGSRSGHPPRSASFPRPDYRHTSSSPARPQNSSQHGHGSKNADPRRASMPVASPRLAQHQSSRPRQSSHHEQRPPPPPHSQSQPTSMSRGTSSQHLQLPSPWTGIPTQSGTLPHANAMPPRQHSQTSMRTSTKTKRQTMIS
ncbi:hypothetical protein FPV67DRAFT_419555 [Lyophyllum atratum]|nr:hypothetical protein FPV67DRAFT_419555 [Lyophyllum atratum]